MATFVVALDNTIIGKLYSHLVVLCNLMFAVCAYTRLCDETTLLQTC